MAAIEQWSRLVHELAEQRRQGAVSDRPASVVQVWSQNGEQKIQVQIGIRSDGSPWLSPWLNTEDHRGSHRHEEKYHQGMNVKLSAPGGDIRQATVTPWTENTNHPPPDHSDPQHHTYQNDTLRERHGLDFQELWLAQGSTTPGQSTSGSSGTSGGSSGGSSQTYTNPDTQSIVLVRMGVAPQNQQAQTGPWAGPPTSGGKPQGSYTVKTTKQSGGTGTQQPQTISHSVNGDHVVTLLENQGISHTTKNNMTHSVQQNWTATVMQAISHSAQGNITHSAGGSFSRSAGSSITDQASSIGHTGNTSITGTLGATQGITGLSFNLLSDRAVKENVALSEEDCLQRICALKVYEFNHLGDTNKRMGLIADEVRNIRPDLVQEVELEGIKLLSIDTGSLLAIAIRAIQQLATMVNKGA